MSNTEKINILLVDDRPENLLALEAIIEREDYQLIKASSGEEALIHLLKYDFATILLDVQMPGIDGFATAKIIKARERTKNIPIIFITANNMDAEHIFTGYSLGAIDYLLKPFDPIILKAKVDSFVEMYKLNQKLIKQAEDLAEKRTELEITNQELSAITAELRKSEALASVISETSIDSMIVMDENSLILRINPAVKSMFHWDAIELTGQNIRKLFTTESKETLDNLLETHGTAGHPNLQEVSAIRKDGTSFPAEVQIGKRYVNNKMIMACTIRDVSQKKRAQELITHMAYHDGLTNLPNRRLLNDYLNSRMAEAKRTHQPFAMLYLDMDRFKFINDSLGHHTGDWLLQEVAKRLVGSVRNGDFVARVGGDEFNIILPDTNRETAIEIAENILKSMEKPFYVENFELFITTSIGMGIFPYDGEDAHVLAKNADAALYRAKEQGKNRLKVYHSGMNMQCYRAFMLQNDLRKAVKRGELTLHYQPRIDLETGTIRSAEAFVRWNHPSWGLVFPSEFIPLAEQTGQIVEIGEWVFHSVCKQIKTWEKSGFTPLRIAVKFSPKQFLQKDIVDTIEKNVKEAGIGPDRVEIEIRESAILNHEEGITATLSRIRKMGITITVDDFGVGYSSIHNLRRFPIDTIKIDPSFIQDVSPQNPDSETLATTIISMARCLKMSVIADGVETENQLNVLKEQNCDAVQGKLFSPPLPPDDFEAFIRLNLPAEMPNPPETLEPPAQIQNIAAIRDIPLHFHDDRHLDRNQVILNAAIQSTKASYSLSSREIDVFELIVEGLSNKEISDKLFISEHTVKNHITHIFQKLNVTDRMQAMSKLYQACLEETQKLRAQ